MIVAPAASLNRHWKTKLFKTSGVFVVPPDVGCIWVDGCGSGGGGGGGNATPGGGGGGGGAALGIKNFCISTTPGESITIMISAAPTGGTVGNSGSGPLSSRIIAASCDHTLQGGYGGLGSTGVAGSAGGNIIFGGAGGAGGATGVAGSPGSAPLVPTYYGSPYPTANLRSSAGGGGGGLNANGGDTFGSGDNTAASAGHGGIGGSSGGGGGGGGTCGNYGVPGSGGSNGNPGTAATGYGCGGGGGSGNAAGGAGGQGFVQIYYFSAYSV